MNYQQEQQEWDEFVTKEVGVDAKLSSVSVYSSDCRIYSLAGSVFKMRRLTPASMRFRLNSLEDEFLILSHLKSISAVPRPLHYTRLGMWEIIEMTTISPLPIHDPTLGAPRESVKDFMKVIKFTWSINKLGCSHGDLHGHNIGRNIQGGLSAFDFDQAIIGNPFLCWLRDFWGIGTYARPTDISLFRRARNLKIIFPLLKVYQKSKKLINAIIRRNNSHRKTTTLTRINFKDHVVLLNDHRMNLLAEAWGIASNSNASSPGTSVAYYSLDINGINFPGERPWILRWYSIKQKIDFKDKKLLELGCNLGLLSIHAKICGASSCLGIDINPDIIRAATLAASAFEAEVKFKQLNLDDTFKWEDDLAGYDIVSALSVMHWVKNRKRLWIFLGKQKEVLYEGHESDAKSEQNLKNAGFTKISIIGKSERGRNIFHAISMPRIIN